MVAGQAMTTRHAPTGAVAAANHLAAQAGAAVRLARDGFPVSETLAAASDILSDAARTEAFGAPEVLIGDRRLRLPRVARLLEDIAAGGRAAFYEGAAGEAFRQIGPDLFDAA